MVVMGLGSNLGDRLGSLRCACLALSRADGVRLLRKSGVCETDAVGPPQPAYLNAAVLVEATVSARELLRRGLRIERDLGRIRTVRWTARCIDIDLLWTSRGRVDQAELQVPHPALTARPFALQPMLAVAPLATDPTGRRYADFSAAREPLRWVALL